MRSRDGWLCLSFFPTVESEVYGLLEDTSRPGLTGQLNTCKSSSVPLAGLLVMGDTGGLGAGHFFAFGSGCSASAVLPTAACTHLRRAQ